MPGWGGNDELAIDLDVPFAAPFEVARFTKETSLIFGYRWPTGARPAGPGPDGCDGAIWTLELAGVRFVVS